MKNKRLGPDFIIKVIERITLISWLIFFTVLGIMINVNPALRGMALVRMPSRQISEGWLALLYLMLIILIIINVSGIIFNARRLKRKSDHMRLTFFISGILAVVMLAIISVK
jgi:hypothetical protein